MPLGKNTYESLKIVYKKYLIQKQYIQNTKRNIDADNENIDIAVLYANVNAEKENILVSSMMYNVHIAKEVKCRIYLTCIRKQKGFHLHFVFQ